MNPAPASFFFLILFSKLFRFLQPGSAAAPENILNRLKDAKDPLQEGIQIAAEQAHDFINIANGIHLMAVKAEHLIPKILEKADLTLEY